MPTAVLIRVAAVLDLIARPVILAGLWVGRLTSWLVLPIIAVVLLTVVMNALGLNELGRWSDRVFLLGRALTINSVIDMQWHLYGVLIMFGATYALHTNNHVRVDFIYERFSPRTRLIIDLVGHLALLIP
ncbi:MAG: TRAP transporter small permease subunit, partial [Natronospirillum sp.]